MTKPQKHGIVMRITDLHAAMYSGFEQLGHWEDVEPTPEQVTAHARAVDAVREFNENPYVEVSGYDYDVRVGELETRRWIADETDEEFVARWKEAGSPTGLPLDLGAMISCAINTSVDWGALIDEPEQEPRGDVAL